MSPRKMLSKKVLGELMLRLIFICSFVGIASPLFSQNQVIVRLKVPPPNKMSMKDVWSMTLKNTTGRELRIYLEGNASESKDGVLAEGKSKVFVLPPGEKTYGYDDFKTGSVIWKNKKYEEIILRTGSVPSGDYTFCVTAYNEKGDVAGQENCIDHKIEIATDQEITLIQPSDGEKLGAKTGMTFMWAPINPTPKEGYTFKLVEIKGTQSAQEAINSNVPFLKQDNIRSTTFQYPISAPKLMEKRKYAWMVSSSINGAPVTSNVSSFSVAGGIGIVIDSLKVKCGSVAGAYSFAIWVTNPSATSTSPVQINPISILNTTPVTSFTLGAVTITVNPVPIGGQSKISGTFTITPTTTSITAVKFFIAVQDPSDISNTATYGPTAVVPICPCNPCKTLGVSLKDDKLTTTATTSGQVLLSGTLVGLNPSTVKKITMELVYYNIEQTGDSNCTKCAENKEWGNFIKPSSSAFSGFNTGLLNGVVFGREWTWLTTVQKDCNGNGHDDHGGGVDNPKLVAGCASCGTTSAKGDDLKSLATKTINPGGPIIISPPPPVIKLNSFSLPIAVPPGSSLKCCGDKIKICIRYTVWDFCCHACDIIKCYELERKAQ
jgi:hypothetical protein